MAVLTWRNVDAPDFRPAMDGIRNATSLLSNAFNSAGNVVDQFTGMQTQAADRSIMQRLANVQDPSQFDANAIIGADGSRASMNTLAGVADRPGTLLEWATRRGQEERAQQNQDFTNWGNTRTQESAAALDAAAPVIQQAQILQRQGREDEATQLLSTLQRLRSDQYADVLRSVDTTGNNAMNRTQSAWRFGNEQRDDTEGRAAEQLALRIAANSPDAATAASLLDQTQGTAAVKSRAQAILSQRLGYGGFYGPMMGSTSAVSGGGAPSTFASNIPFSETRNYVSNISSRAGDLSGMSNEEKASALVPLVLQQESGGRRYDANGNLTQGPTTRSGARAQGEMQVMPTTSRDPGYGVRPAQNNSPEELARVGRDYLKAMLDKYDGNVDQALAAYNAGPSTVDNWLNDQISTQSRAFGTQQVGQRLMERSAQNFARDRQTPQQYLSDLTNDASVGDAARSLLEVPELQGTSSRFLREQIERYQAATGGRMNPAEAARVIAQSLETDDTGRLWDGATRRLGMIFGDRTPNLGGGSRINDARAEELIRQYNTGQTSQNMEATQSLQNEFQVVQGAQAAVEQTTARLAALRQAGANRPGYQAAIRQALMDQATAQAALNAAQSRIVARTDSGQPVNPTLVPSRDRTAPVRITTGEDSSSWTVPGILDIRPTRR